MSPEEHAATLAALARRPRHPDLSVVSEALGRWESLRPAARATIRRALLEIDYHARVVALAAAPVAEEEVSP